MKLITDHPFGIDKSFICMGIIEDSDKNYACLMSNPSGQLYIEEIHWGRGKNFETATLHQVDSDEEWRKLYQFISSSTTIFSPKKIKEILKNPEFYFYSSAYKKTKDFEIRKGKGIL